MSYDLNDAQPNTFEVIPADTTAPVVIKFLHGEQKDDLHPTKNGDGRMVKCEVVVTSGQYAKRKFFLNLMLASSDPSNEGHKKAIEISKSTLRSIVEASRGFAPTDESAQAIEARKLKNISDIDGMEFTALIGVEKGTGGYSDKNTLKRVIPAGKAGEKFDAGKEAASMRSSAPTPASGAKKGW